MILSKTMGNSHWLNLISITVLLCISASVNTRHIQQDFDLEASAAEPRPIFIETGPSAEALPLIDLSAESNSGPQSDASEKVEKILRPALSFTYTQKGTEDGEAAESKVVDQKPAAMDYYKYVEAEEKKEGAGKEEAHKEVDAGGESAESKHHGHKQDHKDGGGDHKEGGGGGEFQKGGGKEFHANHDGEHGEKGDKGYKGHHHHEKAQQGHHDHEDHNKAYDEKGGHAKEHHHKDGYHGEHHKGHHGKKGSKYGEKGEHNKGHSTKGSHSVHKKDEYEKKTEFFDEDHEGGDSEKHGGYSHKDEYSKGGHHKASHNKGGEHAQHHGHKGEGSKGGHFKDEKGHKEGGGHDSHHDHDSKYGKKESGSSGKKWAYREGDGGGGGGGGGGGKHGHGHGAHSHQSYAVEEPPKKEQVAEAAPVHIYEYPPISAYLLPLEGEPEIDQRKVQAARLGNYGRIDEPNDGKAQYSEHIGSIAKKGRRLKKRKPTPTDTFIEDSGLGASTSYSSTESPIEILIRQSLISNIPKDSSGTEQESGQNPNEQTDDSKKVTKKRRLKKRKIPKDAHAAEIYRSSRSAPDCLKGHKKERHIPGESSKSFVIVAADNGP